MKDTEADLATPLKEMVITSVFRFLAKPRATLTKIKKNYFLKNYPEILGKK